MTEADAPRLFAHRGFAGIAPENTVGAARVAADVGADAIECDVVATGDGTPVVFHDTHLDSTDESRGLTDRTGRVADAATDHVTGATVLDSGEQVPTLARFVATLDPGLDLNLELKRHGPAAAAGEGCESWQPFIDRVLAVLTDIPHDVLFSSFHASALAAVRTRTDVRIAPLARGVDTACAMADDLDTQIIHPSIEGIRAVEDGQLAGYTVNAWTARTWQDARIARRAGVDGLIADYPRVGAYPAVEV